MAEGTGSLSTQIVDTSPITTNSLPQDTDILHADGASSPSIRSSSNSPNVQDSAHQPDHTRETTYSGTSSMDQSSLSVIPQSFVPETPHQKQPGTTARSTKSISNIFDIGSQESFHNTWSDTQQGSFSLLLDTEVDERCQLGRPSVGSSSSSVMPSSPAPAGTSQQFGQSQIMPSQMNSTPPASISFVPTTKSQALPLNNTLRSMGKHTVVLIQFLSDDSAQVRNLLTNPMKLNDLVYKGVLGSSLEIADVRPNLRKSLLAIESKVPLDSSTLSQLTSITQLGPHSVKCYVPNSDLYLSGVIHPVSFDADLGCLLAAINANGDHHVTKVDRLRRKSEGSWIDTMSLRLTFQTRILPQTISINNVRYHVRPYVPTPMQCFNCQRIGHTSKSCRAKTPRCMLCGGPHLKTACTAQSRCCVNCGGSHGANSRACPNLQTAIAIEKLRVEKKLDYHTARQAVLTPVNDPSQFPPLSSSPQRSPATRLPLRMDRTRTYATATVSSIADGGCGLSPVSLLTKVVDASTQTDPPVSDSPKSSDDQFFCKLRGVLLDLLRLNLHRESLPSKINLLDNAIMAHFHVPLDTLRTDSTPLPTFDGPASTSRKRLSPGSVEDVTSTFDEDVASTIDGDVLSSVDENAAVDRELWETVEKVKVKVPRRKRQPGSDHVPVPTPTRQSNRNKKKRHS